MGAAIAHASGWGSLVKNAALWSLVVVFGCGGEPDLGRTQDPAHGGDSDCPACTVGASGVVGYQPGTNVSAPFLDGKNALGVQLQGSTHIYTSLGNGPGVLTLSFASPIRDSRNQDLVVYASTLTGEQYQISVSADGVAWTTLGTFTGKAVIDFKTYRLRSTVSFVRIRNTSTVNTAGPDAGPDIDAVVDITQLAGGA